jgi:hypothetical protein
MIDASFMNDELIFRRNSLSNTNAPPSQFSHDSQMFPYELPKGDYYTKFYNFMPLIQSSDFAHPYPLDDTRSDFGLLGYSRTDQTLHDANPNLLIDPAFYTNSTHVKHCTPLDFDQNLDMFVKCQGLSAPFTKSPSSSPIKKCKVEKKKSPKTVPKSIPMGRFWITLKEDGKTRYKCPKADCNKSKFIADLGYTRPHNLKSHYLSHTGELPFQCSVCARKFARRSDMVRHETNMHRYIIYFIVGTMNLVNYIYILRCV